MSNKHQSVPTALRERSADWHFEKLVEFTEHKMAVGEPSPHLAMVGYITRDMEINDKLWFLGSYAAAYCLPTAQVIWSLYPLRRITRGGPARLEIWLRENWAGIVTRTERRCVRSPKNMAECLWSLACWIRDDYAPLTELTGGLTRSNYDAAWDSVGNIKFFGRYIAIRFIEGLRRYCGVPAMLYDIRSVGGWSPKRALCYLYPQHTEILLCDDLAANTLTDELANEVLARVKEKLPAVNEYIIAAMLCEYKACFENRKQYPGWTIDQEPLLYDKVFAYWGDAVDRSLLWGARAALFPLQVLGEVNGWNGTRWELTKTLRDHGYVWSDLLYDYGTTQDVSDPAGRS